MAVAKASWTMVGEVAGTAFALIQKHRMAAIGAQIVACKKLQWFGATTQPHHRSQPQVVGAVAMEPLKLGERWRVEKFGGMQMVGYQYIRKPKTKKRRAISSTLHQTRRQRKEEYNKERIKKWKEFFLYFNS